MYVLISIQEKTPTSDLLWDFNLRHHISLKKFLKMFVSNSSAKAAGYYNLPSHFSSLGSTELQGGSTAE